MKFILFILMIFTIKSCASGPYDEVSEIVGEDHPLAFKQGFTDGCGSGENAAGSYMSTFKRGEEYSNNELYKRGWDDG